MQSQLVRENGQANMVTLHIIEFHGIIKIKKKLLLFFATQYRRRRSNKTYFTICKQLYLVSTAETLQIVS